MHLKSTNIIVYVLRAARDGKVQNSTQDNTLSPNGLPRVTTEGQEELDHRAYRALMLKTLEAATNTTTGGK